jgi:hypothetical protein
MIQDSNILSRDCIKKTVGTEVDREKYRERHVF